MINIIDLKTSIYNMLLMKGVTTPFFNVYEVGRVPKEAVFPYVTFNLEQGVNGLLDDSENINFDLEVTILDHNKQKDTTKAEEITNRIAKLHTCYVKEDTLQYRVIRNNVILSNLPTVDEFTVRREITFNIICSKNEF